MEPELQQEPRLEWPALTAAPVGRGALAGSLVAHLAGLALVLALPEGTFLPPAHQPSLRSSTVLIAPPTEMTQRAPNRARIGKEFSLDNLLPRPPLRVRPAVPPVSRQAERALAPPPRQMARALPEPPSVDTARTPPPVAMPPLGSTTAPVPPPPQIQEQEKPKLAFETPGAASGSGSAPRSLAPRIQAPGTSVMEATRESVRSSHGGVVVGDYDLQASPGIGRGLAQLPAPGKTATALEMLSDPGGVDFKPYLIRILAAVKRNWLAVIPESARQGRAGRVLVQFAIARDGYVPKLVIAVPSGADALDRAAVAGISASTPFEPLPSGFKGNQVRLQFSFSYNLK
ncbi:MAG TPA: TonB family protein [Bryobacteraceae bacterium]|nr:TonB family protein [Bryobacteraceae bacterium]